METNVKPKPEEYHSITPVLSIKGADQAIEFYKKALNAREISRLPGPGGRIVHAELKIGDSVFMLGEEMPEMGCMSPSTLKGTPVGLYVYVNDVDAAFQSALQAGAKQKRGVEDMFWGDRCGTFTDPFGHNWTVATHKKDLTPKEIEEAGKKFFLQPAQV